MSQLKALFLLQLLIVPEILAWRLFHRGRERGGNLGRPKPLYQRSDDDVTVNWFTQTLDHFNTSDGRNWQQRYYVNTQYFTNTAFPVVFLLIGGEAEATAEWMTWGTWVDFAEKFGALCIQIEHRYYGESKPTPDMSVENLKYLSSEQALADIAQFISTKNKEFPSTVKWITFGGSYSGALSAWARERYPHLVYAAVASSAPILAQVNFEDYFKVVDASLATSKPGCVSSIRTAFDYIYQLLRAGEGGVLNVLFKLCDDITKVNSPDDIASLFTTLADNFAVTVQYNNDGTRVGGSDAITIDTLCDIMTDQKIAHPLVRLAKINYLLLNNSFQTCTDYKYQTMIEELRNVTWGAKGMRQWTYQTCTEFGFYQTSDYKPQVFGHSFPVWFSIQQCIDTFGPTFNRSLVNRAVDRTNTIYGGLNYRGSQTIFVQGTIDPWHVLGLSHNGNGVDGYYGFLINGTAHCADMYPPSSTDPPDLIRTRYRIFGLLAYYIF